MIVSAKDFKELKNVFYEYIPTIFESQKSDAEKEEEDRRALCTMEDPEIALLSSLELEKLAEQREIELEEYRKEEEKFWKEIKVLYDRFQKKSLHGTSQQEEAASKPSQGLKEVCVSLEVIRSSKEATQKAKLFLDLPFPTSKFLDNDGFVSSEWLPAFHDKFPGFEGKRFKSIGLKRIGLDSGGFLKYLLLEVV